MKAITRHTYGPPEVLAVEEVERPPVGDGDVLIRIRAASANPRDWHFLRGAPYFMRLQFGVRRPRDVRLGSCVAGTVEAVGPAVTRFAPGDDVYADVVTGGFAEYVGVAADLVARRPANLTFEQAAAVPLAALTALQGLRDVAPVRAGQKVLVVGAAGGVGTFAVQLAHWYGAEVTGVCSGAKADLVRSLGADHVIDYTHEDFTRTGAAYDLIFQLAGTRPPWQVRRALAPDGVLIDSSGESDGRWLGPVGRLLVTRLLSCVVAQRLVGFFVAKRSGGDLEIVRGLIEDGTLTPVIDRTYPLAETPEAIRYVEEGHARGKVIITI